MRVVILAGGRGTRLSEETDVSPKPMLRIGERPILWHIMKHFDHYGFKEFCVALGYKSDQIKQFFRDYSRLGGSMTLDMACGAARVRDNRVENWLVHLVETGLDTSTGGRLLWLAPYLRGERFLLTYGDGVSSIDLRRLVALHESHGRLATITAVRPPARFGCLAFEGDRVSEFTEKPQTGEGWINGGFMVLEPEVLERVHSATDSLERDVLESLAREGELFAYRHPGFWQCMDTKRDLVLLESLWTMGEAPWKSWDDEETFDDLRPAARSVARDAKAGDQNLRV